MKYDDLKEVMKQRFLNENEKFHMQRCLDYMILAGGWKRDSH